MMPDADEIDCRAADSACCNRLHFMIGGGRYQGGSIIENGASDGPLNLLGGK